ncbi:MAG: hypothetical protein FWE88_09080 [Phycisphaerae bacterium]|nr:hypothetical protein [Phycisphaerae bacterium]
MGETPMRLTGGTPVLRTKLTFVVLAALVMAITAGHSATAQEPTTLPAALENELATARDKLTTARRTKERFEIEHRAVMLDNPTELRRLLGTHMEALTDVNRALVADLVVLNLLRERNNQLTATQPNEVVMIPNPKLAALEEELKRAKDSLAEAKRSGMKPAHPTYQQIERMIVALEQKLANEPAEVPVDKNGLATRIVELEVAVKGHEESRDWLNEQIRDVRRRHEIAGPILRDYRSLVEMEKRYKDVVDQLEQSLAAATADPDLRRAALKKEWQDITNELKNRSESIDHPDIQPLVKRLAQIEQELADEDDLLTSNDLSRRSWWSSQTGGWIAGLLGVSFVLLTTLYLYLMRKHAPYKYILGVLTAEFVLGVACLALGIVTLVYSQPIYTFYPLFFIGGAAIAGALAGGFKLRRYYREIELRKMRAMDTR